MPQPDLAGVLDAMRSPRAIGFRVNTLRTDTAAVKTRLGEAGVGYNEVDWFDKAMWIPPDQRELLIDSKIFREHHIYVQNLSSMAAPLVLDPQPGERILDLTAAPGSKTTQLACLVDQVGELAAVEVVKNRFFRLRENLREQGADKVKTFLKDGQHVWKHRTQYFDRVLLDAPCSSEGRFQEDNPDSYRYWSERKIKEMVRKQKRLLFSAIQSLRPGGTLVYSTCSLAPEENEGVISRMLQRFPGIVNVVPLGLSIEGMRPALEDWKGKPFDPQLQHARRILPSYLMEGFFLCKMEKVGR